MVAKHFFLTCISEFVKNQCSGNVSVYHFPVYNENRKNTNKLFSFVQMGLLKYICGADSCEHMCIRSQSDRSISNFTDHCLKVHKLKLDLFNCKAFKFVTFPCNNCSRVFDTLNKLEMHKLRIHTIRIKQIK